MSCLCWRRSTSQDDPEGTLPHNPTSITESDEAFPNAEHIFKQAFAAQDPAPHLLHILKEHPTYPAIYDLVFHYTEAQWITTLIVDKLSHPPLPGSFIPQMHLPSDKPHSLNFCLENWRGRTSNRTTMILVQPKCTVQKTHTSSTRSYLGFRSSTT